MAFKTINKETAQRISDLLAKKELSIKEIADQVGVKYHIVANIASGRSWADLSTPGSDAGQPTGKRIRRRLTKEKAMAARELMKKHYVADVEKMTGLPSTTLYALARGQTWSELGPPIKVLSPSGISDEVRQKIILLGREGKTLDEIVLETGAKKNRVIKTLKDRQDIPRRRITGKKRTEILDMYKNRRRWRTVSSIASAANIAYSTAYRVVRRAKRTEGRRRTPRIVK